MRRAGTQHRPPFPITHTTTTRPASPVLALAVLKPHASGKTQMCRDSKKRALVQRRRLARQLWPWQQQEGTRAATGFMGRVHSARDGFGGGGRGGRAQATARASSCANRVCSLARGARWLCAGCCACCCLVCARWRGRAAAQAGRQRGPALNQRGLLKQGICKANAWRGGGGTGHGRAGAVQGQYRGTGRE